MGLFSNLFRKNDVPKDHPIKLKDKLLDEKDRELDLIVQEQLEWVRNVEKRGIDRYLSQNPDYVIRKMLSDAIDACQENIEFAIQKMNEEIEDTSQIDSVDMLVIMKVVEYFNDLINRMKVIKELIIIDEGNKLNAAKLIIETIGLFEGLKKASRIDRQFVFGWSIYIKQKISLDSIQAIPERAVQALGGSYEKI